MSPSSFAFAWVLSGARRGSLVHSVSNGFTRARVGVSEFIRVGVDPLVRTHGSRYSFWFASFRLVARGDRFGFSWVHSGMPRGRCVHLRSRVFTRPHLGVSRFIQVGVVSLGGA